MDALEKEKILFDAIGIVLERMTREYDFTHAQMLGVLRMIEENLIESNRGNEGGE